MTIPNSTDTK